MGIIAERWLIDECVHLSVHRATGIRKLTGMLGREELAPGAALRLTRCRSVHGFGMKRPLDVIFVNSHGAVTSVRELAPWRMIGDRAAAEAFEFRRGEAARMAIRPGMQFHKSTRGE
ncbi:MAG: DUF192 domain-containing protein [Thermoleophilaceae bacterium]|nr:DUF192 domain-containing protein [Thermoleophilaceae bacterium]